MPVLAVRYDLVMFSSSLQCLTEWQDILLRAGQSARRYLLALRRADGAGRAGICTRRHRSGGQTCLMIQLESIGDHGDRRTGRAAPGSRVRHGPVPASGERARATDVSKGWLYPTRRGGRERATAALSQDPPLYCPRQRDDVQANRQTDRPAAVVDPRQQVAGNGWCAPPIAWPMPPAVGIRRFRQAAAAKRFGAASRSEGAP